MSEKNSDYEIVEVAVDEIGGVPEDAIVIGAFTFFEKEAESVKTEFFVQKLKQHVAINLESLYFDDDVTTSDIKDCISQLQNMISTFEDYADNDDVEGIKNMLKELGFDDSKDQE